MERCAVVRQPIRTKSVADTGIQPADKGMPDVTGTIEARVEGKLNGVFRFARRENNQGYIRSMAGEDRKVHAIPLQS
jgi:hypothetical protein